MSSNTTLRVPSSSSSPNVILTNPTPDERPGIWSYSYTEWASGLTLQAYIGREAYMLTVPLARDGGLTNWLLTDSATLNGERPVLSSCETLRKPALVRGTDGVVRNVWAYGVASVFTPHHFRGRGYAGKMMALLAEYLAAQQRETGEPAFSVLFSDIGKLFYAKNGWLPFENTHLEFPVKDAVTEVVDPSVALIHDEDLPALAELDEKLLRHELSPPSAKDPSKIRVAISPSLEALQWHFSREAFICNSTVSREPTVRGAIYTPSSSPNSRVWGLWVRDKNLLNFIRFVIEDNSIPDDVLSKAIRGILSAAQKEAKDWSVDKIDLWNPSDRVKKLVEEANELESTFFVREDKKIASLNWFGEGSTGDVEWVANEKFEWC